MKGVNKVDESAANYVKRLRKELQLDISQWCRIKSLHRKGGKAAQPLLEQLRQLGQEMRAVSETPTAGDRTMYDLAARRVRLEVELARLLARTQAAIYQTFTPEQQQRLSILHRRVVSTSRQVALV
jgi:Spy/CpxP family protein refolding chaperone